MNDVDQYLENLEEGKDREIRILAKYMRENHPNLEEVISFRMPTYILKKGKGRNYISFSAASSHWSMHSLDFEEMERVRGEVKNGGKGKGCVNVSYGDTQGLEIVMRAIERIIKRQKEVGTP